MDADIIDRMRREEAELTQKLEAVRAVLRAYGHAAIAIGDAVDAEVRKPADEAVKPAPRARERLPLDRFTTYGRSVVHAATEECKKHPGSPISSRDMVSLVESRGIIVRGEDKANAISALLARSIDLKANGRKGWTLSDEYRERQQREVTEILGTRAQKENAPQDTFDDVLGADAEEESAATPTSSWSNPQTVRTG